MTNIPNHNTELEELVRDIMKVPYSKHNAKSAINTYLYKQTLELIPKDWPVDSNKDRSPLMTFNKARNSAYAEMRRAAAERWGQV